MIIYSEKTKKTYTSVEACAADEAAYDAKIAEEKRIAEEKEQARKVREVEVTEAYDALVKAEKRYNDLVDAYNNDYGYLTFCEGEGCDFCEDKEDEKDEECETDCECHSHGPREMTPQELLAALVFGLMR